MESKARAKSRYIHPTIFFLLTSSVINFTKLKIAILVGIIEIGLQLPTTVQSPVLGIGVIVATFQAVGKTPNFID